MKKKPALGPKDKGKKAMKPEDMSSDFSPSPEGSEEDWPPRMPTPPPIPKPHVDDSRSLVAQEEIV